MPVSDQWKRLAANGFRDFKLKVGGLVENPIELSLEALRELGKTEYISMHHCNETLTYLASKTWLVCPVICNSIELQIVA
ncbi:MAG: molybdopterin-dependent oxidoreductase [Verrucomicrobiota bacterium]|jgi:DMSO/TMAO reductase YedYZ molybdopterin-dependent catalytic subunit